MLSLLRQERTRADQILLGVIGSLVVLVPILNLVVPESSVFHMSTFAVT